MVVKVLTEEAHFLEKIQVKVDRSGAYAMRHIAKNMVAAGVCNEILVQVSYAIGIAKPTGLYVNTYGSSNLKISDGEIAKKIMSIVDLRPSAIEKSLKLRSPIYSETAAYGHMGRTNKFVEKTFRQPNGIEKKMECRAFHMGKIRSNSCHKINFQFLSYRILDKL